MAKALLDRLAAASGESRASAVRKSHSRSQANKPQIKEAVEKGFNVKVTGVNVMIMKGKPFRVRGNRIKHQPDWKKAVVTLAPGDKLELFEGV
jgi:ribosomal protein L23